MGRLGVPVGDTVTAAVDLAAAIVALSEVRLEGIFSNLAAADAPTGEPGHQHTRLQIERFARVCSELEERGLLPPERHLCNSAAVLRHLDAWTSSGCNGVRPGLSLYGVLPFAGRGDAALAPVMSWHSVVASVRRVPDGWPLGYGARCRAEGERTIAVVPVGYHDGFPRALSDACEVLVGGRRAQVVGAISMDLTLVDITGFHRVVEGDPVVLLGASGEAEAIDARELAERAGSIAHEVLCRVGRRVPRRYAEGPR